MSSKGGLISKKVEQEEFDDFCGTIVGCTTIIIRWKNGGDMQYQLAPVAPILEVAKEHLSNNEENIDVDGIRLIYHNKAIVEGDTPDSLGMKNGEIVRGIYIEHMQLRFVLDGDDSAVSVRIKPNDWSKIRMKEVFGQCAEKIECDGLDSLQFRFRGILLLSSVEMATPGSL